MIYDAEQTIWPTWGKYINRPYIDINKPNIIEEVSSMPEDTLIMGRMGTSTRDEFVFAEEKMQEILEGVNDNWSIAEKTMYLDVKIGELLSFDPRAVSIVYNRNDQTIRHDDSEFRALWHNIAVGKAVCNGIVDAYRLLLQRTGIKSKDLHGNGHVYCLVYDENGKSILVDPTWDLDNLKFGIQPAMFGVSYEKIQEDEKRTGKSCHKLADESVLGEVRCIDDKELREINTTIGNTVEIDGQNYYRLKDFLQQLNLPDDLSPEEKTMYVLKQFQNYYGNDAKCLAEVQKRLITILGMSMGWNDIRGNSGFVYRKGNDSKKPILLTRVDYCGKYKGKSSTYIINDEEQPDISMISLEEVKEQYSDFELGTIIKECDSLQVQNDR